MAARPLAGLAICAGVGGLELGLHLALGDAYRTVGYVERDSHAAAVLVARMEDQALDPAPVWDDVETFEGRPWRRRVDLISAGFPCQPFSAAGRGRGVHDDRWLWPQIARIVDEVQPAFVFCENVPPLVNRGLDHVLRDLAHLGFAVEWTRLSAAAVGASHRRQRLWILAHRDGQRLPRVGRGSGELEHDPDRPGRPPMADTRGPGRPEVSGGAFGHESPDAWRSPHDDHVPDGRGQGLADAQGVAQRPGSRQARTGPQVGWLEVAEPSDGGGDLADAPGSGWQGSVRGTPPGRPGPSRPGDGLPLWPPGPDDHDGWQAVAQSEGPQPCVRRMADGLAHRVDRLRAIGNGVVPLVAAHALLGLAHRAGILAHDDELTR